MAVLHTGVAAHSIRQWPGVCRSSRPGLAQRRWCKTASIEPGSRWVNGYRESFDAGFRDELLNGEIYYSRFGLSQRSEMLVAECHQSIEDGIISINEAKRPLREAIAPKQVLLEMALHLEQENT